LFYVPPKDEGTDGSTTDRLQSENRRRPVILAGSSGGFATAKASSLAPDSAALAATFGIEPSKLGSVVMVNNKKLSDVRNRAELLAAKYNGKVFPVPQSTDATGQVFFVEVPREDAATFRSELLQDSTPLGLTNEVSVHAESGSTTEMVATSTVAGRALDGVLVAGRETNESFNTYSRLNLVRDKKSLEPPTVVLEIIVVPPSN
jgi:hypothetical protein